MTEYRIVRLEEKKVAGLCAQTSNTDPKMGEIIGGLWQSLYGKGIFDTIPHKVNKRSIGLYSDYRDEGYDITVGCEVDETEGIPGELTVKSLPAGNYAEFILQNAKVEDLGKLWGEIWQLPLERTFTGDFEEYYDSAEAEGPSVIGREVRVYIAVK